HRRQMPAPIDYTDAAGVRLGLRWRPLAAVGIYVPGGTAAYPSSVLMNAIPARVAGVERVAMVVPAPDGVLNPLVLAAARLAGIDEVYRVGGAQAVAALAYGTATIAPVDKIVGPGNAYVAAAKRRVFGKVGIDMIAGPSEILVVADAANDPAWIAADLLSQAEHDPAAQAILVTDDGGFADAVEAAIAGHLARLPRAAIARQSWQEHGAVLLVSGWDEAAALIDRIAPEHVELAVAAGREAASRRGDLPRPPCARGGGRLRRRPQPRPADDAQRALCLGPRRARFHEAHDPCRLRRRQPGGDRSAGDPPRRGRGARRPCAVAVDPAPPAMSEPGAATQRIAEITLDERTVVRRNPEIEHERATAIADLVHTNHFAPASGLLGPFRVHLATHEGRLSMEVTTL